jgi:hypothetical protein
MSIAISGSTITFADLTTQSSAPVVGAGFKNRIYNGDMRIWQRGTTFAVGSATFTYTADRFKAFSVNTSTTVSRSTSVPTGFQYSYQLQRPSGNTGTNSILVAQIIETANCYDLAGQPIALSFWVKKGANYSGGNITVQVLTGTVADQGGNPYNWTGLTTAINDAGYAPTTTWSKVTFTGTVASNVLQAAVAIQFVGTGTAGADDSLYITGVQLEQGSTATEFERRPIGTELGLCQRYYELLGLGGSGGASSNVSGFSISWKFSTLKRATPSISHLANYTGQITGSLLFTVSATTLTYGDSSGVFCNITSNVGSTIGYALSYSQSTPSVAASAEL